MRTLTPYEVSKLLNTAKGTRYYPIIYVTVNTGLRQTELLGLRWRDLNLGIALVSVSQVLYKRRGACQFKEPKSAYSRRGLGLSTSLTLFLRQYKTNKQAEQLLLGKTLSDDDPIFSNPDESSADPGTLTRNFAKIAHKTGL